MEEGLLPAWVPVAGVAVPVVAAFVGAFLVCAVLYLLARRAARRHADAPWPERARALWPYRRGLGTAAQALALVGGYMPFRWPPPASPPWLGVLLAVLAGYLGGTFWRVRLERSLIDPDLTLRGWLRGALASWCCRWPHLAVALVLALVMPATPGPAAAVFAGGIVLLVVAACGGGFLVGRAVGLFPPAPAAVDGVAREVARGHGVALRGVHAVELPMANAFALPVLQRILFTRRAIRLLDEKGVAAIARHEVAHLQEPRRMRYLRLAGLVALLPVVALRPLLVNGGLYALLVAVLVAVACTRLLRRRFRALESRADEWGRRGEESAGEYAHALESLYRANLAPAVLGGRAVHPDLYDRLEAAGVEPAFPRPAPPARTLRLRLAAVTLLAVPIFVAPLIASHLVLRRGSPAWAIALDGSNAWAWATLARASYATGDYHRAAWLYAEAAGLEPDSAAWFADAAMACAASGWIEEAENWVREAEARAVDEGDRERIEEARRRIANARRAR